AAEVDDAPDDGVVFESDYAESRQIVSWVLGLGERARILGPPELVEEAAERVRLIVERHAEPLEPAPPKRRTGKPDGRADADSNGREQTPIRPERFARLVTLAGILIDAARRGVRLDVRAVRDSLQVTDTELREDIDVL